MYGDFLQSQFQEIISNQEINIGYRFRTLTPIELVFDAQFGDEVERFIQDQLASQDRKMLGRFVNKLKVEFLITPQRAQRLMNSVAHQPIAQLINDSDIVPAQRSEPVAKQMEFKKIIELQAKLSENAYIIARCTALPLDTLVQSSQLQDFTIQVRDDTGPINLFFVRNRLQNNYLHFYSQFKLQSLYRIEHFEVAYSHLHKKVEIKVRNSTKIILLEDVSPLYSLNRLLQERITIPEELDVACIVDQIEITPRKRTIFICTCRPNSDDVVKMPLVLWDEYKSLAFNHQDIVLLRYCILSIFNDRYELKPAKQKFSAITSPPPNLADVWLRLDCLKEVWFRLEFQEISEHKEPEKFLDLEFKVIEGDAQPVLDMKIRKIVKIVTATADNCATCKILLVGDRLHDVPLERNKIYLFTNLEQRHNNTYLSHETLTTIIPTIIDQLKQVSMVMEAPRNEIKLKIQNKKPKVSTTPKKATLETLSLAEGKITSAGQYFNATVHIDYVGEIKFTDKGFRKRDMKISDATATGMITLWNDQILPMSKGQSIYLENVYFDKQRGEFKTAPQSKVIIKESYSEPLRKGYFQIYDLEHRPCLIQELLATETRLDQYVYSRGIITEVTSSKVWLKCPRCPKSKVAWTEGSFECVTESNRHQVQTPTMNCFVVVRIVDYTGALEAIVSDDLMGQLIPQDQQLELAKKNTDARVYIEKMVNKDYTFKLMQTKNKNSTNEELKRFKLLEVYQTNFIKEAYSILSYLNQF